MGIDEAEDNEIILGLGAGDEVARLLHNFSPAVEPAPHEPGVFWIDAGGLVPDQGDRIGEEVELHALLPGVVDLLVPGGHLHLGTAVNQVDLLGAYNLDRHWRLEPTPDMVGPRWTPDDYYGAYAATVPG